ncbi:MAG: hypothetical protein K9M01_04700, partial [Candidatus Omnitrophica bacterium]|nr:hypothetical protein [Candidatus Omnitrophota bacterium]
MDALKEIRDNIRYLSQNKGQQSVDDTDVSSTSGASQDDEFDDSNSATHETVENEHYEGMRQTIEGLYQALLSSSTGLSTKSDGNMVKKTEWETMKTKTDDLAETSVAYSNVLNYSVGPYTEHTNTVTN